MAERTKTAAQVAAEIGIKQLSDAHKPSYVRVSMEGENRLINRNTTESQVRTEVQDRRLLELEKQLEMTRDRLNYREQELARIQGEWSVLADREKQLSRDLTQKEVEVQRDRAELRAQFADRETSLRHEMETQQAALKDREAMFRAQSQDLMARTAVLETEHLTLQRELKQRAIDHEKAIADLVRQKEQYEADFQSRMESKATEYVDTALASLQTSEERFDRIGSKWAIGGLLAVIAGLILAYFLAAEATEKVVSNKDISWSLILFFGVKGAILLGMVVGLVRVCIRLARNYMQESLKSAERRHAINYGKFYLSVYGAGTDGEKLKDVFAQWNISGASAFAEKEDPFPQPSMSEISELTKALTGFRKASKEADKD